MPFNKIQINAPLYQNVDDSELSETSPERRDVFRDETGTTVRRPGLSEFTDTGFSNPIDGMYYWEEKDRLFVVTNGKLLSVHENGAVTTIASDVLNVGTRAIFDEAINPTRKLFVVNGSKIVQSDGATAAVLSDANAPTTATHLSVFDTYLLANEPTAQKVHFSEVGTPESWGAEFFVAEERSDNVVAISHGWGEVACFGTQTVENFYDDGVTPFVPIAGASIETGVSARYSIKLIDNSWFILNEERRLVRIIGRQPQVKSIPVDRIISGLSTVADAIGDHLTVGGRTFYVLTFPAANKTLVYDYARDEWAGEWGYWENNEYGRWRGNCCLYIPKWNKHLVGDYENGKIYEISPDVYQDDGNIIRSMWRTGNIDHGTSMKKRSLELRIRARRGLGDINSVAPTLMIRWRDDGNKAWGNTRNLNMGLAGDTEFYIRLHRLGAYRSRQYEISCTDNIPIGIVSVEENIEQAGR
jgi:hypothetical protein